MKSCKTILCTLLFILGVGAVNAAQITETEAYSFGVDMTNPAGERAEGEYPTALYCHWNTTGTKNLDEAFDNIANHFQWINTNFVSRGIGAADICYTWPKPVVIRAFSVEARNILVETFDVGRAPKNFKFYGTNDSNLENATWTYLGDYDDAGNEVSEEAANWVYTETSGETRFFSLNAEAKPFTTYKWKVLNNNRKKTGNANTDFWSCYTGASELQFIGYESATYPAVNASGTPVSGFGEAQYGTIYNNTDLTDGQTVTLNGPDAATYFTTDNATYYLYTGYRVTEKNADTAEESIAAEGTDTTASFTYRDGYTYELEWLFDTYYKITAATAGVGSGTVSVAEQYALAGSTVTLSVTPDAGYQLVTWTAGETALENATQTTLSFTATATDTITARIWYEGKECVQYVSENGDNANDGLTEATARKSISSAISTLSTLNSAATIYLLPGTHAVSSTLSITSPITMRGTTGNPADVIIQRGIYDGYGHIDTLRISNKDARVEGITFKGGSIYQDSTIGAAITIQEMGGTVENCIIEGFRLAANKQGGGAVSLNSADALVNRCIIRDPNTCLTRSGASETNPLGIYLKEGTVANTLLCNLKEPADGEYKKCIGAIYAVGWGAKVINCTIVNCAGAVTGAIRAGTGALVANTVIADCTDIDATSDTSYTHVFYGDTSAFLSCATDKRSTPINASCIVGTAEGFFRNYATLDLYPTRLLLNKGTTQDASGNALAYGALDCFGKDRVQMGAPDIGYAELPPFATLITIQ